MPATVPATITAAQVILGFEHNQTVFIEVKIPGLN